MEARQTNSTNAKKKWILPVYRKPDSVIYALLCPSGSLKVSDVNRDHYLYPYIKRWGNKRFFIKTRDCKQGDEVLFPEEISKRKVAEYFRRGGIVEPFRGIAMGLVLGSANYLSSDTYEVARNTGTLHLFAASGLHIGIFMGSLYFLGKYVLRLGYYSCLVFPLVFAWGYLFILSFPVSLTRAYYFALVLVASKILFRKIQPMDLLITSATVIYIFREETFLSVGFNLSFLAVSGIFFLKPALDRVLFGKPREEENFWQKPKQEGKLNLLKDNLSLTLSANLATFPIAWLYFPGFSFGSILSNFFLVPYTGILLPIVYFSLLVESVFENSLSEFFWVWTDLGLRILLLVTEILSDSLGFFAKWDHGNLFSIYFLLFLVFYFFLFYYFYEKRLKSSVLKFYPLIRWMGFLAVFGFFFLGFRMHSQTDQKVSEPPQGIQFYSHDMFVYIQDKKLSLGGYCRKDNYKIQKVLNEDICRSMEKIYVDHETCVHFVRYCFRKNHDLRIEFGSKYLRDWGQSFPEDKWSIVKKNSFFEEEGDSILFFKAGFDPDWLPGYITKKFPNVKIIHQTPKVSKKFRKFRKNYKTRKFKSQKFSRKKQYQKKYYPNSKS